VSADVQAAANGKRRLVQAALRLCAENRSLLEHPKRRRAIIDQAVKFIVMLHAGALAMRGMLVDAA